MKNSRKHDSFSRTTIEYICLENNKETKIFTIDTSFPIFFQICILTRLIFIWFESRKSLIEIFLHIFHRNNNNRLLSLTDYYPRNSFLVAPHANQRTFDNRMLSFPKKIEKILNITQHSKKLIFFKLFYFVYSY